MESAKELQGRILLVDDESAILRTFRYCLEDEGYTVATANSAAQADALMQRQVFDLCFLDLRLGEDNGLDVLAQMRIQAPWMRVVIVTAHSAVDTAVDAIQAGAADYLVKPCSPDQLRLATAKQLEVRQLSARLEALEGAVRQPKDGLDSHSPSMMVVLETARQVAGTDANILILGESELGIDWELGPSDLFARYAFNVEVDVPLTGTQRSQIRAIVDYLKPAHTHFVDLIEPGVPPTFDHWELGISELGWSSDLH